MMVVLVSVCLSVCLSFVIITMSSLLQRNFSRLVAFSMPNIETVFWQDNYPPSTKYKSYTLTILGYNASYASPKEHLNDAYLEHVSIMKMPSSPWIVIFKCCSAVNNLKLSRRNSTEIVFVDSRRRRSVVLTVTSVRRLPGVIDEDAGHHCDGNLVYGWTCQSSNPQLHVILVRATCTPKPRIKWRCASDSLSSGRCHQIDVRYQCLVGFYHRGRSPTHWTFFEPWNSLWFLSA